MYNEDKKLITEITRKNNMDENLAKFADAVMTADFEYACQKFALNYVVIRELMADKDFAEDPYIYECVMGINKLVGTYLAGDADQLDDKDLALISEMRNKITEKMKVLTAYTDAFELYEYILNRKEYGFEENVDEELEKMFEEFDAEQFSAEVFNFIFADKDKVAVNAKIQQIVGQLPLRMTKARFYDIIGQTLSIYNGCEISSLDDFIETVEETALLQLPEKFETEYSSLHEAYEIIKEGDYAHLDFDGYRNLSTVLDKSAGFINDVVSDYMMLIELVNDLYSMMLAAECKSGVSESCMRALSIIRHIYESMENEDEFPTDAYDMLVANEGAQEEAGEHRMVLEAPIYDIVSSNQPDIIRLGLEDAYHRIDTLEKLLSGSMFVDIDHVKIETGALADSEYIISKKDKLIEEFGEVFTGNSQVVNRAVMAKILSTIPVFFNTQQEIKDYIDNALVRCSNRSEVLACYVIIQGIMED